MPNRYPTLKLMGIENADQIQSYSLSGRDDRADTLKITYRRPAGSFLPTTRKYDFDRTARAANPAATGGELQIYEISPILEQALVELDTIVHGHETVEAAVEDILNQISELEKELAGELGALRAKIKKLAVKA